MCKVWGSREINAFRVDDRTLSLPRCVLKRSWENMGLECRVQGSGFRVDDHIPLQCRGLRLEKILRGYGSRVQGLGFAS